MVKELRIAGNLPEVGGGISAEKLAEQSVGNIRRAAHPP
jgi:hypothetical protein